MKHLVVDARGAVPEQTDGVGTYVRQIVPQICSAGRSTGAFRTTLLVHPDGASFWRSAAPEAELLLSALRPMRPRQNWEIPLKIASIRPDLFFYPGHDPPLLLRAPLVFTIHDVTLFQRRPYFESFDRAKLGYMKLVTPAGLRRARAVLAVSHYTREAIGEIFGARFLPKVHVTQNGICSPSSIAAPDPAVPRDRLLYVGTDRPHKNLQRVLEAYALARRQAEDLPPLEIVGGMRTPAILRQSISRLGLQGDVRLRGHLSDAELEECYGHAVGLVFPSLAEGFGLPILEAMVRGVPVITSNSTGCAEVAGDAALTVDPLDPRAIAEAMVRLFREPALRAELVRKGHQRSAAFTWKRTASETLAVLNECLSRPSPTA
jgi:glycosyltransferase involved in cell wall biosynthesis